MNISYQFDRNKAYFVGIAKNPKTKEAIRPPLVEDGDIVPYLKKGSYFIDTLKINTFEELLLLNPYKYPNEIVTLWEYNDEKEKYVKVAEGSPETRQIITLNGYTEINTQDNTTNPAETNYNMAIPENNIEADNDNGVLDYENDSDNPTVKQAKIKLEDATTKQRYPFVDKDDIEYSNAPIIKNVIPPTQPIVVSDNEALNKMIQTQIAMIKEQYNTHIAQLKEQLDYFKENGNAESKHLRDKIAEKDAYINNLHAQINQLEKNYAGMVKYYEEQKSELLKKNIETEIAKQTIEKEQQLHEKYQEEIKQFQQQTEKEVSTLNDKFDTSKQEMITTLLTVASPIIDKVMQMIQSRRQYYPQPPMYPQNNYNMPYGVPPQAPMYPAPPNYMQNINNNTTTDNMQPNYIDYNQYMQNTISNAQSLQNNNNNNQNGETQ